MFALSVQAASPDRGIAARALDAVDGESHSGVLRRQAQLQNVVHTLAANRIVEHAGVERRIQ